MSTPPSPQSIIKTGALGVIVPPDEDGGLPPELLVGCFAGPVFHVADLTDVALLSVADPGGVRDAIEPFLSSEEGGFWPQEDWLILSQSDSEILLVHDGEEGLSFMTTELIDAKWQWSGSSSGGSCPLYYQMPPGLNAVDWRLDPEGPALDAETVNVDLLVTERECVSGQEIGDRLLAPEIVMTTDTVRVALAAEPPAGNAFDCQGNPETPLTITLPAPLGDREIVEGLKIGIDLESYLP